MSIEDNRDALELYKEVTKMSSKLSIEVAGKLDRVADNLKEMNDLNVLHQKHVMMALKTMQSWQFKLIIALIAVLSIVAIGEKAIDVVKTFI